MKTRIPRSAVPAVPPARPSLEEICHLGQDAIAAGVQIAHEMGRAAERADSASPRGLHAICEDTRLVVCTGCWAPEHQACTGTSGLHLSRFAVACQRELISRTDFASVVLLNGPAFAASTVIYDAALERCPVSGPFETERDARESARPTVISAESITEGHRTLLKGTVMTAGVELGAWDRQILDWLADFETSTVAVVAGLVSRAHNRAGAIVLDPERVATVLDALSAAKWTAVGKAVGCDDCDVIEIASRGQQAACERHAPDLATAGRYDEMGRWLARAADLPVDDEPEATPRPRR